MAVLTHTSRLISPTLHATDAVPPTTTAPDWRLIRVATGSATVASITAAGILEPPVTSMHLSPGAASPLVLAGSSREERRP